MPGPDGRTGEGPTPVRENARVCESSRPLFGGARGRRPALGKLSASVYPPRVNQRRYLSGSRTFRKFRCSLALTPTTEGMPHDCGPAILGFESLGSPIAP